MVSVAALEDNSFSWVGCVSLFFASSKFNLIYSGYISHVDSLAQRNPKWKQYVSRIFINT